MPLITPLARALLPQERFFAVEAVERRLRQTLAPEPTMETVHSLTRDVASFREFLGRVDDDVHFTQSQPWPFPQPSLPGQSLTPNRFVIDVIERWGWQLENGMAFGCDMRSHFVKNHIPMCLVAYGHGSNFGLTDQRMECVLRAGAPSGLNVAVAPRSTIADVVARYFRHDVVVDREFDHHFVVYGDQGVARALFTPVRDELLECRDALFGLSLRAGAISLTWESRIVPKTVVLPEWALAAVMGVVEAVRTAPP